MDRNNVYSNTSIGSWWKFKLTEIHSKSPSAFATIHQVIAIQCISQHPYIVAISGVTVEALDKLFCSFVFCPFSENIIKLRKLLNIAPFYEISNKYYIWRLGGSNLMGRFDLSRSVSSDCILE